MTYPRHPTRRGAVLPIRLTHHQPGVGGPAHGSWLMAISSVTITLNTLLLKRFKPSIRREDKPQRGAGTTQTQLTPVSASGD